MRDPTARKRSFNHQFWKEFSSIFSVILMKICG